jgi:quercetin dioxygenase-like cupin family protein
MKGRPAIEPHSPRPPVTHTGEALEDVEAVLIEIRKWRSPPPASAPLRGGFSAASRGHNGRSGSGVRDRQVGAAVALAGTVRPAQYRRAPDRAPPACRSGPPGGIEQGGTPMKQFAAIAAAMALLVPGLASAQDAMQYHVKHLRVLAEDDKVRVLQWAPRKGDKTPMHSHPASVVYVVKGGRVHYTFPDGSTKDAELKTGDVLLRPPVTHADEALDDVEAVLVELKK